MGIAQTLSSWARWFGARPVALELDPADQGTAYGMELSLGALDVAGETAVDERGPADNAGRPQRADGRVG